ncbi:30S ribosomal protein S12 methylthiotransferase RimO [Oxobacter pfennigii]|nr:30S ribosomal protein S12 methylthiotransferase RimO [Oxobacter pfennigii]
MVSLGCDKNRVDAELMLGSLISSNYNIVRDEEEADIIIVNTCGFIESAKQESIDAILEYSKKKDDGRLKVLIASGCLAERYSDELMEEIPELDAAVGTGDYMKIEGIIDEVIKDKKRVKRIGNIDYDVDLEGSRVLTTQKFTAYVKIAEGCNNSCSYCIIPKLRGIYRSRSLGNIEREVKQLAQNGTKEIILVAQDITKYGSDLYGRKMLVSLIKKLSLISEIDWIRLMYCYPEDVDDELIQEIKNNDKVCKYIDLPLQHINDEILYNMRRLSNKKGITSLINKLRENIPDIIIRTSLIVGFPGETDEQFNELYDFLAQYQLDRVGVFIYSQEEDTEAALYKNQIDEKTKKKRQRNLISLQKKISRNKNKANIGKTFRVLVDGTNDKGMITGRTYGDAPDIDGRIYITKGADLKLGEFVDVNIKEAYDYDMAGEVNYESS